MDEEEIDPSIVAAIEERRWSDARELIERTLASMSPDWKPVRESDNYITCTFWDQGEFLAYVDHHGPNTEKGVMWSYPSYSKL